MSSPFVAIKTRVKQSRERRSAVVEDETISEGSFWYVKPNIRIDPKSNRRFFHGINQKEVQRLKELVKTNFFTVEMLRTISNMNEESGVRKQTRLRSFDWAVTNFTKGHPTSILKPLSNVIVDPHVSYASELHSGHRLLFDPFRRGTHIYFEVDNKNRHSTVGQLCFLKWCFDNGIDKYVDENSDRIKKDMATISKRRRHSDFHNSNSTEKRTRMELTPTPKSRIRGLVPMTELEIQT